jgi:hypothetical protein
VNSEVKVQIPQRTPTMAEIRADQGVTGANAVQHGGKHYKALVIQPWDYIAANEIPFLEGNAIKYLTRWRDKGGLEDLRKARHYVDKLIELETQKGTV